MFSLLYQSALRTSKLLLWVLFLTGMTGCGAVKSFFAPSGDLPVTEYNSSDNKTKDKHNSKDETGKEKTAHLPKHKNHLYRKNKKKEKVIAPPAPSELAERVVKSAEKYLGTPYVWGGTSSKGVDCSGLMVLAFGESGLKIARISGDQAKNSKPVRREELKRGDLLFFSSGKKGVIGHTAMVTEINEKGVKFIHAASGGVRYDYLESAHWSKLFICAGRYFD